MLLLYRLLLPFVFLAALPGWLVKTARRGGWNAKLLERFGIYSGPAEFEPCGATHVHAVSVGETMLALKLIRAWSAMFPEETFVLSTGTPTGRAVAEQAALSNTRVAYQTFDIGLMVRAYLRRFEPRRIVLVEGEMWPNLMALCPRKGIPVSLVNARMSPRSARRYRRFAKVIRPVFSKLSLVCTQNPADNEIWHSLGVENVSATGSLKFDPGTDAPRQRTEFAEILTAFGKRPVVLAASTHPGEETHLANAIRAAAPHALPVIAPRHAERAADAAAQLTTAGFTVHRRSSAAPRPSISDHSTLLLIDTTGELRDWTAHADVVLIGKSFLSTGGQNPAEAILAGKPVVTGPHMENFQPLAATLVTCGGVLVAKDAAELRDCITQALDPTTGASLAASARQALDPHAGAVARIIREARAAD